jgi:hypothetical protein
MAKLLNPIFEKHFWTNAIKGEQKLIEDEQLQKTYGEAGRILSVLSKHQNGV